MMNKTNIRRMMIRRRKFAELWFLLCVMSLHFAESQSHFIFTSNTGVNATIAIPASASPNISGVPIAAGDEIGVFTPSGLCVGAIVWNGGNAVVTCWGDNDQTGEADGFTNGEKMRYRLWQRSSDYEFKSINVTYSEGDGIYNANGIYVLSSFSVEGTVTIEAECLVPACIPDSIAAVASFSFCRIIGSPKIETIRILRSGTACDADVPKARLYRDMNRNKKIDAGDLQLDSSRSFSGGYSCFEGLNYSTIASENLLIVFEIASGAELSNSIYAVIDSNEISGSHGTDVIFHGVTTPEYPLHLGIIEFNAAANGDQVLLMWKNASEVNTFGFMIERKWLKDANNRSSFWNDVAFIERIIPSSGFQQYSYTDTHLPNGRFGYRLKHIDRDGTYFYSELIEAVILPPDKFILEQNFPNPFNPTTTITFTLPAVQGDERVTVDIFSILGEKIAIVFDAEYYPGKYSVQWDASRCSSGMYLCRLRAGKYTETRKLLLMK